MERTHRPGRATGQHPQELPSGSLVEAIDGLSAAVSLLAERLGPPGSPPPPGGRGRHLRMVHSAGPGDSPWDALSVVELRALLREVPIDRTSLPAPIENLRRAELVEALRQVEALGFGGEGA
ncbi:MAG: hypothetical protein VKP70_09015 [Cyanobacteriota bacterium]|nr:hypothetical protein [Cyanobacteriota bacterium]